MDSELEEFFIIERDSGDPSSYGTLEQLAVLREISPELDEQLKLFLKAVRKRDPKRKRDDGIFNTVVERALKARLAQYPTSVEDDEALLSKDNIGKRHRMAVEVRLGEKRVLQEALVLVQGGNNTVHGGEERAGKRTKRSS